jgi:hypothetical protein
MITKSFPLHYPESRHNPFLEDPLKYLCPTSVFSSGFQLNPRSLAVRLLAAAGALLEASGTAQLPGEYWLVSLCSLTHELLVFT